MQIAKIYGKGLHHKKVKKSGKGSDIFASIFESMKEHTYQKNKPSEKIKNEKTTFGKISPFFYYPLKENIITKATYKPNYENPLELVKEDENNLNSLKRSNQKNSPIDTNTVRDIIKISENPKPTYNKNIRKSVLFQPEKLFTYHTDYNFFKTTDHRKEKITFNILINRSKSIPFSMENLSGRKIDLKKTGHYKLEKREDNLLIYSEGEIKNNLKRSTVEKQNQKKESDFLKNPVEKNQENHIEEKTIIIEFSVNQNKKDRPIVQSLIFGKTIPTNRQEKIIPILFNDINHVQKERQKSEEPTQSFDVLLTKIEESNKVRKSITISPQIFVQNNKENNISKNVLTDKKKNNLPKEHSERNGFPSEFRDTRPTEKSFISENPHTQKGTDRIRKDPERIDHFGISKKEKKPYFQPSFSNQVKESNTLENLAKNPDNSGKSSLSQSLLDLQDQKIEKQFKQNQNNSIQNTVINKFPDAASEFSEKSDQHTPSEQNRENTDINQNNSFNRTLTFNLKFGDISLSARYSGSKMNIVLMMHNLTNQSLYSMRDEISHIIQDSGIENYFLRIKNKEREINYSSDSKKIDKKITGSYREINVKA